MYNKAIHLRDLCSKVPKIKKYFLKTTMYMKYWLHYYKETGCVGW